MTKTSLLLATGTLLISLAQPGTAQASDISMPAGSRSWILVRAGDCDDDGPNVNVDRGHCIGAVSVLNQPGDIGHDQIANYQILANATIGPETMHGSIQATSSSYAYITLSMIDTYTLNSSALPSGTVVPITVSFHAVGSLIPGANGNFFGSGGFYIKIGSVFIPDPIVTPESSRVGGFVGPNASASFFQSPPGPSAATIPLDLTATATLDVAVGTPFDLAYQLGATPTFATIDFSNTATISFNLPAGTHITSTGGYGQVVPVVPATWSGLKTRSYR